jgi:hypothetical protein
MSHLAQRDALALAHEELQPTDLTEILPQGMYVPTLYILAMSPRAG